jgi:gluconolactonase
VADAVSALIEPGAVAERLATGFRFTEGPLWDHRHDRLTFSDVPAGVIHRWSAAEGISVLRAPSNRANGNAFDPAGRMVTCEHDAGRVVREAGDGTLEVLADRWGGAPLNSPNDVVVDRAGAVYFTDPDYGCTIKPFGGVRPVPQAVNGVYRIAPDGGLTRVVEDMRQPNGLCFSADGTRLFINDTARNHVRRFEVLADGSLMGGAVWTEVPGSDTAGPDGMKLDSLGNLYCTGLGGIHVYDAQAQPLGVIDVGENVGNFTFGGPGLRTLFVCATRSLYALRMRVPGLPAY